MPFRRARAPTAGWTNRLVSPVCGTGVRMWAALPLLADGERVAHTVGYATPSGVLAAFGRTVGTTPERLPPRRQDSGRRALTNWTNPLSCCSMSTSPLARSTPVSSSRSNIRTPLTQPSAVRAARRGSQEPR